MEDKIEKNGAAPETEETQDASSVFRRSSVERISSPEQLNDYIRVASPRMWVALIALAVFLAGALVWAAFGHIGSTVYGVAIVEDGKCTVYIAEEKTENLKPGCPVEIEEKETKLLSLSTEPFTVTEDMPEYARRIGEFSLGEWVCPAETGSVDLPDGIYAASVEEERLSALSLLTELA